MKLNLIPEVFVPETGCFIKAATYFDDQDDRQKDEVHTKRRELLRAKRNGQKLWVCAMCQEPVYIAGGLGRTKRRAHFKHFVDTPRCPYQTHSNLDQETIRKIKYNGAKESPVHRETKETLADLLERDPLVSGKVDIEKTFFHQDHGKEWRRPDITCDWNDLRLVLEIQISSDFLDVIVGREDFYRKQGVFILWVFNKLDPDQYTTKDIYVGNQKNCFIFNERVKALSREAGILTFECHFKRPRLSQGKIVDEWKSQDVTLKDLTFDRNRMQAFWHDYDQAENRLQRAMLLGEFETYWCHERTKIDSEASAAKNMRFEKAFHAQFGIELGWTKSKAANVLDALYDIRNTPTTKADQIVSNRNSNLFSVIDTMFNSRKPFLWVVLWALNVFDHRDNFKNRPAFINKMALYKAASNNRDEAYRREQAFDPLFKILFPQLAPHLEKETEWYPESNCHV